MTTRLVIAGAGGFGREVFAWVADSPQFVEREGINEIVFIADSAPDVAPQAPLVSTIIDFQPLAGDRLICAIGSPQGRRHVAELLAARGAQFATFVHDNVLIGSNVHLGEGVVVCPGVTITTDARLGVHAQVNVNCVVAHDVEIGEYVTLSPNCMLSGNVTIDDDAFLGTSVTVIPGKTIGAASIVGAGSIVVKDVRPGTTVFGNPAAPMPSRRG